MASTHARRRIVFLASTDKQASDHATAIIGPCVIVRDLSELEAASGNILLCFGSGVIVPKRVLDRFTAAYNIHAASPEFPGRDPHHWAVYAGARRYGATMHVMTERVDSGPIVDVEWFDVAVGITARELLDRANAAAAQILARVAPRLQSGEVLRPVDQAWSGATTTRAKTLAMCELSPDLSRKEVDRRQVAFDGFPMRYPGLAA